MWTGCQGQSQTPNETPAAGSPLIRGILFPCALGLNMEVRSSMHLIFLTFHVPQGSHFLLLAL